MLKKIMTAGISGTIVLLFAGIIAAAPVKTLTVVGYVGKAEVKISKTKWKTLNIEDKVTETNEIRILKKYDYLELAMEDGIYRLTGKTTVKVADLFKKINSNKKRIINLAQNYKVETTTAPAAVLGNRGGAPDNNARRAPVLPPELSFVVTGLYKGACSYRTGNKNWQTIGYGIRLPKEAEIKLGGADSSVQLNFFDKSSTNITGPAEIKVLDVLAARQNPK